MSIVLQGSTSGSITLQEPAIAGSTVLSLPATTGTVLTSASPSSDLPSSINGPAFSTYVLNGSANQLITQSTFTKIKFDTENFDTNNNFDSTTNYRFTPTVAGYYQINGIAYITGTSQTLVLMQIYKNGSGYLQGNQFFSTLSGTVGCVVNDIIYMNGSTDYLELYGYSNGTSPAIVYGLGTTRFSGALIRGA